jgi:hypothetical protein
MVTTHILTAPCIQQELAQFIAFENPSPTPHDHDETVARGLTPFDDSQNRKPFDEFADILYG